MRPGARPRSRARSTSLQPARGAGTILAFERALERFEDGRPFLFLHRRLRAGGRRTSGGDRGGRDSLGFHRRAGPGPRDRTMPGGRLARRTDVGPAHARRLGDLRGSAGAAPRLPRLRRRRRRDAALRVRLPPSASASRSWIIAPPILTAERFPAAGAPRLRCGPKTDAGRLPSVPRTYAVVKTHSFAHDREWVRRLLGAGAALRWAARAAGAHGEDRCAEIGAEGDARVFGPVGLDLGADGPEQVALSIVAELLAVQRRPGAPPPARAAARVHAT